MAHNLATGKDGKAAMMYVGQEPWHGLGTKLDKAATSEEAIGEFLDWLGDQKGAILATTHIHGPDCLGWDKERGKFNPAKIEEEYCRLGPDGRLWGYSKRTEDLLAEFFEIDLAKCEAERRAILARIRGKA